MRLFTLGLSFFILQLIACGGGNSKGTISGLDLQSTDSDTAISSDAPELISDTADAESSTCEEPEPTCEPDCGFDVNPDPVCMNGTWECSSDPCPENTEACPDEAEYADINDAECSTDGISCTYEDGAEDDCPGGMFSCTCEGNNWSCDCSM